MKAMLGKVVQANQKNWDNQLPKVLFAYRTAVHESNKFTPFHLRSLSQITHCFLPWGNKNYSVCEIH